jgi:hypothetical protein
MMSWCTQGSLYTLLSRLVVWVPSINHRDPEPNHDQTVLSIMRFYSLQLEVI